MKGACVILLATAAACQDETQGRMAPPSIADTLAAAAEFRPHPPDSLVLVFGRSTVWHTLSREARSPSGETCLERTLEIRHVGVSPPVRVPLLYTMDVPELIDDSTLEARVYRNCAPGDLYRIHVRTGQPTPVR